MGTGGPNCDSCSREYKGDAWHLLSAGLTGGKGAPDTVTENPTVFATLTLPSFGPVHGRRQGAPCRARRDRPVCPHGQPLYWLRDDREVPAAVLDQVLAPVSSTCHEGEAAGK
ncbi:MAG TPA: replication initiator [Acidimicrobiales bacterium]|nr:replication initiator [Acidimicrobiales bacterium]